MHVEHFWQDVLAQNRAELAGYFLPDAVIRWHCTNEQFSVKEFIQANCDYPGDWKGTIERVERQENQLITVVRVFSADRSASHHVVSFIRLEDGKIKALDEYWAEDGDAPAWRKALAIGRAIPQAGE